ncbi:MAG: hypothetical protein IJ480_02505 [Clostridia bacterium]|nr:hypothetical protein [Clostridia bacterium]
MKKLFSVLLCGLLAALCVAPAAAADVPYATATNGTPVVDGQIDDVWAIAETFSASHLKDGTEEGITNEWKALWDEENVYLLIEVKGDTKHFFNGSQSWGDGCEIYFDTMNNDPADYTTDDGVIQIGWDAETPDDNSFKGTEAALANITGTYNIVAVENDDGYLYEISVALADFCEDFTFAEGAVVGFDIQVNSKSDESESRTSAYGWADKDNTGWQYPYVFGDLELIAAPVVETVVEEAAAPQTFDMGVIAAAAAALSAAGYVISKKR